jgi:IclR family KDG regulon transcriptional repressor
MKSLENPETDPERDPGVRTVQSVSRAFVLLRALARAGRPLSLSDLARKLGTSKPATYHLLRTLVLERAVARTIDGTYELGWCMWELGNAVVRGVDLARISRFHLDHLADQTGDAALLSILDGHGVLYLDRGQSSSGFELVANVGRRSSLHANASGKVLLAFSPPEFIDEILQLPLKAFTTKSITSPIALRTELDLVREQRYAACWQEQELGMSSLAVPIRDHTGSVIAALAIAGPTASINSSTAENLLDLLRSEADAISAGLGFAVVAQR